MPAKCRPQPKQARSKVNSSCTTHYETPKTLCEPQPIAPMTLPSLAAILFADSTAGISEHPSGLAIDLPVEPRLVMTNELQCTPSQCSHPFLSPRMVAVKKALRSIHGHIETQYKKIIVELNMDITWLGRASQNHHSLSHLVQHTAICP